jgi:hypothetical protein
MICAGIKDVENRTWKPAEVPGRILIHASSKKVTKNFNNTIPEHWESEISDHQLFGNLPEYQDMPTSSIIGYATVTSFAEETDSIWDGGPDVIKWKLEDAWLFDDPIMDVRGKLNLFDYPLDEKNLPPAHQIQLKKLEVQDDNVFLPLNANYITEIENAEDSIMSLYYAANLTGSICKDLETGEIIPVKTITLRAGDKVARYELISEDTYLTAVPDIEDNTKPYMIETEDSQEYPWLIIQFGFGKKI